MSKAFPNFTLAEAQRLFVPENFSNGLTYYRAGKLAHPSRFENKLYAEVQGSGSSAYKISLTFLALSAAEGEDALQARCTCPAARKNPLCKHVAAVLAAWATAPESFVTIDNPPELEKPGAKKARVKTGEAGDGELIARGLEAVETLAAELGLSGLSSVGESRVAQVRELAANLRSYKLRRLSTLLTRLADLLDGLLHDKEHFSPAAYAEALADLLITAKGVRALQQGKLQDPKYLEELVGKTWSEKELSRREGLELVELLFEASETADGFRVFSSYFLDLGSGDLLAEKLIVPSHLTKAAGKRSYAGLKLSAGEALQYPGYAPWRIKFKLFQEMPLSQADIDAATARANPDFAKEIEAFQAFKKDFFAPAEYYAFLRPTGFYAATEGLAVFDAAGCALPLRLSSRAALNLEILLERAPVAALFGKLQADGGKLVFEPLSAVSEQAVRAL